MTSRDCAHASATGATYEERYSDAELAHIVEQGMVYMCACPAQVADTLRKLRALLHYQADCMAQPHNDSRVHAAIIQSTIQSHQIMQTCLDTIIDMEQWDRTTLEMPAGLRRRQIQELQSDE